MTRLEQMVEFLLDHAYNVPKDWRDRVALNKEAQYDVLQLKPLMTVQELLDQVGHLPAGAQINFGCALKDFTETRPTIKADRIRIPVELEA